jgi:hypothetical protein
MARMAAKAEVRIRDVQTIVTEQRKWHFALTTRRFPDELTH